MAQGKRRALVAGNWKMNGSSPALREVRLLASMLKDVALACDVLVCPPATLTHRVAHLVRATNNIMVGGQDCHKAASGAFTGDIAAEMLKDAGASAVIVGHSERRAGHGETDADVKAKAAAAHRAGLSAIVCIGETLAERQAGQTLAVVSRQLQGSLPGGTVAADTIIAYEPVWAIGTGLTPKPEEVAEVHKHIRGELSRLLGEAEAAGIRLLYGGSVKPDNAHDLLTVDDVDGALVGGASLEAADFIGIIKLYA